MPVNFDCVKFWRNLWKMSAKANQNGKQPDQPKPASKEKTVATVEKTAATVEEVIANEDNESNNDSNDGVDPRDDWLVDSENVNNKNKNSFEKLYSHTFTAFRTSYVWSVNTSVKSDDIPIIR